MDKRRTPERYEYEVERARMFQEYASFFPPDQPPQGDRTAEGKAGRHRLRYVWQQIVEFFSFALEFILLYCLFAAIICGGSFCIFYLFRFL